MARAKILICGMLLLAAVAAAGNAYVRSIDFDSYRPALVAELRAATGRNVAIDGPVELSLFPRPRFVLSGIAIANAPWGTRDALARIDRVEADIALLPLLGGRQRISRIRVYRPDLWFETDSVGKVNWVYARGAAWPREDGAAESLLASLDVARIDIEGGRVTYRDGKTGDITVLSIASGSVEGDGYAAPLALDIAGEWNSLPFALGGAMGPFNAVASDEGDASAVSLRLDVGGAVVRLDGAVGDPRDGPGAALKVTATVPEPGKLARRFGIALPLASRVALDAEIRYRRDRLDVDDATLTVGKRTATGRASLNLTKPRATFTAAIHVHETDLIGLTFKGAPVTVGEIGPLDALIDSGLLAMADGTATIRTDILRAGAVTLRDVEADVALAAGRLVADPVRGRSVGGVLEGSARLDTASVPARLSASIKAPAFAAGSLLQHVGSIKAFGGVASIAVNLATSAGTPEAMLAGLEGEALLAMGEGRLTLEPFDRHLSGAAGLVGLVAAAGREDVAIECVAGRMTLSHGVARSTGFLLLSQDARVKGEGTLDLAAGTMAFRFMPEARDKPLLLPRPVSVAGPLLEPVLTLESEASPGRALGEAALAPLRRFFAEVGVNPAANACLRALPPASRKRVPSGQPIAQRPESLISGTELPPSQKDTPAGRGGAVE